MGDEVEVKVTVPETEEEVKAEEPTLVAIAMTVGKIAASLEHMAQRQDEQKASIEELWNKTNTTETIAQSAQTTADQAIAQAVVAEIVAEEIAEEAEAGSDQSVEILEVVPEESESKSVDESEPKANQKHPMKSVWDHF